MQHRRLCHIVMGVVISLAPILCSLALAERNVPANKTETRAGSAAKERQALLLLGNCVGGGVRDRGSATGDAIAARLDALQKGTQAVKAGLVGKHIGDALERVVSEVAGSNPDFCVFAFGDSHPQIAAIQDVLGNEEDRNEIDFLGEIPPPAPGSGTPWIQEDQTSLNMNARIKPLTWYRYGWLEFGVAEGEVRVVRAGARVDDSGRRERLTRER